MELNQAAAVLDLGCGVGNFGAFWRGKFPGRIDGADGVRFPEFRSASYAAFHEANLNEPLAGLAPGTYDAVFSLEVIHYLDNPRAFVRGAAALLRPGGLLVLTTPNPLSLPSVLVLLRRGVFRDFQDGPQRYPGQKTPILPIDGERMSREAGLTVERLDFSRYCRVPGMAGPAQTILPFLGGRWFSDHFRLVARRVVN
jgi:SAM-dependent methyltransferase